MPPRNKSSVEKPERKQPARAAKKRINYNNQQLSEAATRRAQAARAEETPAETDKKPVKKPKIKKPTTKKPTTKAEIKKIRGGRVDKPPIKKRPKSKKDEAHDETPSLEDTYSLARDTGYAAELDRLEELRKQEARATAKKDNEALARIRAKIKAKEAKVKKMKAGIMDVKAGKKASKAKSGPATIRKRSEKLASARTNDEGVLGLRVLCFRELSKI
jgi:hypothetical protein